MEIGTECGPTIGVRARSQPELGLGHSQSEVDGAGRGRRRVLAGEPRVLR